MTLSRAAHRWAFVPVLSLILVLAACAENGDPAAPPANGDTSPPPEGAVEVSADDMAFDTERITVQAGDPVTIAFTNHESQPHNIAVYTDSSRDEEIFRGDIITGPDAQITYEISGLEPGEYYFDCSVHPAMSGTLVVEG